jgi:integrase
MPADAADKDRRMVRAELLGSHSHETACGVRVHVWLRAGTYLARGSYLGQRFGETLGSNVAEATGRLRRVLNELEDGSYVRPTEARQRPLSRGTVPRLTLRQLMNEYLTDRRQLRGRRTADTYRARLTPVLDFAERPTNRQRWPLASSIDHDFAVRLRAFLHDEYRTTRNGRPGGSPKPLSGRHVYNVLECLRAMLAWARRAEVRKLPVDWGNPLTEDVVGKRPAKSRLREDRLPLEERVRLVTAMDRWQLCQLSLSLTLPLRPDEAAGLLIADVNWAKGWFEFGTRLGGGDFNKGRQDFILPFPDALRPILGACVCGRSAGPLLRQRAAFDGRWKRSVASSEELVQMYEQKLAKAPRGSVLSEQDRKQLFRRLLRELGGVSADQLAREFKSLLKAHGLAEGVSLYTLRHAITTAMHRTPGLPHLELTYLTGHATRDILTEYVALDPVGAMGRYFATIRPLLDAVARRAQALGLLGA